MQYLIVVVKTAYLFTTKILTLKAKKTANDSVRLTLLQQDLLTLLKQKTNLTGSQLSEHLHVSIASIWRVLSQLKELDFIERKGSDKNGHWIVK